jgi:recombinational DNA repair protein RecT
LNQYWWHAVNAVSSELGRIHDNYRIDWASVQNTLLQSAEHGLSFDPRAKELYLEVQQSLQDDLILTFQLGLKYNGMKNRLVKSCGVRMLTTEVVYENDTFEWRGQWKEPLYIMANEESDMRLAFGMVKLKDGDVMAYKLSKEELLELEAQDIERASQIYNNPNASFYKSAYRKRMFEIATLRYIYSQLVSMLEDKPDELGTATVSGDELQIADIAEAMEAELNATQVG